jgi:UDPglucose--hexose-1-phosphate uridylyltransferase
MLIAAPSARRSEFMAELRRHPVSGEWVLICPERGSLGSNKTSGDCVFCPGSEQLTGPEIYRLGVRDNPNPAAWRLRVIVDSPPLFHVEGDIAKKAVGLCDCMEAIGAHEVLLDSPAHATEFEDLDEDQIVAILTTLGMRAADLENDERLRQIVIFKVRVAGSAEHPRWHIVATPFVPGPIKDELNGAAEYFSYKERCVFCDYIRQERKTSLRLICEEPGAIALSPYAASFPFETWILPTTHTPDFRTVPAGDLAGLARVLKKVAGAMTRIPDSLGYIINLHTAPFRKPKPGAWKTIDLDFHWHLDVRPRLDLLNGLKESGAFHLNPVVPEAAAETLRSLC